MPTAAITPFFLDAGMWSASNASSGEPSEVPDDEANAHLGNPGLEQDAYVLVGGSMQSKEMSYVQLSRARGETHLFCDVRDGAELERLVRRSEEKLSAHGVACERGCIHKEAGRPKERQEQAPALELAV